MIDGRPTDRSGAGQPSIAALLRAAEPPGTKPLGELVARLGATGELRGLRSGGHVAGPSVVSAVAVASLTHDSRLVRPGGLFVAVPGGHVDGHDFASAAQSAGAAAVIVERVIDGVEVPQIVVTSSRRALASAACWWYTDPSHSLGLLGVTGTDGKTTTCYLAAAALEATGHRPGMLTTAGLKIGSLREDNPVHMTTPEAPTVQAALRAMVQSRNDWAVVETTSHGLAFDRVGGIAYDAAILTNLGHEHLELHGSFEAYREAKLSLFRRLADRPSKGAGRGVSRESGIGIVNRDDPSAGWFMAAAREAGAQVLTFGADPAADVRVRRIEDDARRVWATVATPRGELDLRLPFGGRYNVFNALAVVTLGEALELDHSALVRGLADCPPVPGRMERLDVGQPYEVVVDFAHTPGSLRTVLDALAPAAAARGGGLIIVFGSAGERDTAKRPLMGRVAGERCRLVVLADEDPRGEDRVAILEAIARGAQEAGRRIGIDLILEPDRRAAIALALDRARAGDIVLLAGKGHERSIIMADHEEPWDERAVARAELASRGYGLPGPMP